MSFRFPNGFNEKILTFVLHKIKDGCMELLRIRQSRSLLTPRHSRGSNPSERLGFVFAHEQAHISFEKALSGAYGPEAKARATKAQEWVSTASPEAKKVVEDVIRELHLGKELAGMDGVRDVLANMDPKEWLANNMAMYAAGL
jgi:hypothetical protein